MHGLVAALLAHSHYQDYIPNGRNVPGVAGIAGGEWHAVGHVAPRPQEYATYILGGFPRNDFGRDFMSAGRQWTVSLCRMDSDGDGLTNGQELGDPHCIWRPGGQPTRMHNLSHPGMDDAALQRFVEKRRSHGQGWGSGGLASDPFTHLLFYYQFVAIPLLLGAALGASCAARSLPSWRRAGAAPFPRLLGIFAAYWIIFIIGVGCGVHRYFSHKSYTASRTWKFILAFLSLFVGQGGPMDWAYVHRIHHRLCEHELDYHSPFNADETHEIGFLGLRNFVYAHATWLITPHKHVRRSPALEAHLVPDLVYDTDLAGFNAWVASNALLTKGVIGWILPGVLLAGLYGGAILLLRARLRARRRGAVAALHGARAGSSDGGGSSGGVGAGSGVGINAGARNSGSGSGVAEGVGVSLKELARGAADTEEPRFAGRGMMSLSMVVIASLVSAPGLGVLVLRGIRNLELGVGLLSGLGIVVLAIVLDRTTKLALTRFSPDQNQ